MSEVHHISELDKLFLEVGTYKKGEDYKDLLDFVKKFPKMAPYNAMLLHVQKPGSSFVASAYEWQSRYRRRPKPGARPLVILRPFGPVAFVFELGDTEGKPFPKELLEPFSTVGNISQRKLDGFLADLYTEGIVSIQQDYGTSMAGYVESTNEVINYGTNEKPKLIRILFNIILNSKLEPTDKIATAFHELGHVFCGHILHKNVKWLPQWRSLSINEKEFEAESVCWLLCERLGIDNPSAQYLSGYLNYNDEIPLVSIDTILKAVGMIEKILDGNNRIRKELLIKG
ncbi:MAG: hypothetical protein GX154_12365 [Clostridiales bacterium]|nr:hypothetical protein [Clostridiales bacterium]